MTLVLLCIGMIFVMWSDGVIEAGRGLESLKVERKEENRVSGEPGSGFNNC